MTDLLARRRRWAAGALALALAASLTACRGQDGTAAATTNRTAAGAGAGAGAGTSCPRPDPHAYPGGECYSLAAALKLHGLVLPSTATAVGFKVGGDDQLWLSFTDSPAGLAEFVQQSKQCTPALNAGVGSIDENEASAVGWPFDKYLATIYTAQVLLNCEGGTPKEDDRITVYPKSATEDIVYWYSQSMDAFNN